MKTALIAIFSVLLFAVSTVAQVSPVPVAEAEVRDNNSIRMRSLQLERVKREASKPRPNETSTEAEIRFAEIKEDFEGIQKLETAIVKAYTTGEKINFEKIRESASEMRKKAIRLGVNFFDVRMDPVSNRKEDSRQPTAKRVRGLIIELDKAIGIFVNGPIFRSGHMVDARVLERSQLDLEKVITLSSDLARASAISK